MNIVAHRLARKAISLMHNAFYLEDFPSCVAPFVEADISATEYNLHHFQSNNNNNNYYYYY